MLVYCSCCCVWISFKLHIELSWKFDLALVVDRIGNDANIPKKSLSHYMCVCIALNSWFIRWIVINIYPLNSRILVNKSGIYDCRLLISTPLAVESSSFEMSPAMSQRTYSDPNFLKSTGVWETRQRLGCVLKRRGASSSYIQGCVPGQA